MLRYFLGNTADWSGGAIENFASASVVSGCVFSGNTATNSHGGAMAISGSVSPRISNNSFTGNHAGFAGGGIAIDVVNPPVLANSILWGNTDPNGSAESQQIHFFGGSITVNYCLVEGWTGSLGGAGNSGLNPLFVDADGGDDTFGTEDDDLRLAAGSPAIDSGDDTRVEADVADLDVDLDVAERQPLDLDDQPRFVDDSAMTDTGLADPPNYVEIVDRGAYEVQFVPGACGTCEGDLDGNTTVTGEDIQSFIDCILAGPVIGPGCECADTNMSTDLDFTDVGPFVNAAILGVTCP